MEEGMSTVPSGIDTMVSIQDGKELSQIKILDTEMTLMDALTTITTLLDQGLTLQVRTDGDGKWDIEGWGA